MSRNVGDSGLTTTELDLVGHAINADGSTGKPWADTSNVRHFTATYAAKCIRLVLDDKSITNMTADERTALESALGKLRGEREL